MLINQVFSANLIRNSFSLAGPFAEIFSTFFDIRVFFFFYSMELKKTVEDQKVASSSLFLLINNPFSWIVVLSPLMITFLTFYIIGCLSCIFFVTSTVMIFSTVLFIFCKRKPKLMVEKSSDKLGVEEIMNITQQQKHVSEHDCCLVRSPDVLSETECVVDDQLSTNEDSEVEWPIFRDYSDDDDDDDDDDDGSISDEDSLIEISLPGGYYVSHNKEDQEPYNNKYGMQQKLISSSDFMAPESIFQQRSLMELLAEFNDMNEIIEDNLIEIDISMGSIKCSRFEIQA